MGYLIRAVLAGFIDIWFSMTNGLLSIISGIFDNQFGYNTTEFATMVDPNGAVLPVILDVFTWMGIGLAVLFLGFGIWKSVFGESLTAQRENPLILLGKFFMAIVVVYFIFDFVNRTIMSIFVIPHSIIENIVPPEIELGKMDNLFTSGFSELVPSTATMDEFSRIIVGFVVVGVCTFIFITKFLKLFVEMIERYLLMNLLIYSAPLAASTIASPSLSSVFAAWCKMLGGQMILILYNVFSVKLILTAFGGVMLATFGVGSDAEVAASLYGFMMLFGLLNVAQRFDTYLNQLSINAGITGMAGMGMGRAAMQTMMIGGRLGSMGRHGAGSAAIKSGDEKDSKGAKISNAKLESKKGKEGNDGASKPKNNQQTKGGRITPNPKNSGGKPKRVSDNDIRKREVDNATNALDKSAGGNAANKPADASAGAKINTGAIPMGDGSEHGSTISSSQENNTGAKIEDGVVDIGGSSTDSVSGDSINSDNSISGTSSDSHVNSATHAVTSTASTSTNASTTTHNTGSPQGGNAGHSSSSGSSVASTSTTGNEKGGATNAKGNASMPTSPASTNANAAKTASMQGANSGGTNGAAGQSKPVNTQSQSGGGIPSGGQGLPNSAPRRMLENQQNQRKPGSKV